MQREGTLYTILFAAAVCFVCSAVVSSASVLLKGRQDLNRRLDKQKNVLAVAGLMERGAKLSAREIQDLFDENILPRLVDLETGDLAPAGAVPDPAAYDQRRAREDPRLSAPAPQNAAQVRRLPRYGLVYVLAKDRRIDEVIIPIEGKGLWSTLYGFLALDGGDVRTIRGITFYEHAETPGLGGEVDNPRWKALWKGRLAFDETGDPGIRVKRGAAGAVDEDPYQVDGLSGATITSQGVTDMLSFWLGKAGFGPFLDKLRKGEIEV